ncbi:hypothetical protein ACFXO9_26695 [Nocardia tengchongensis]|uniref:hypothetical protein n=1 Tax=Nocardia tengchongensis TaxID=2055889 RepID=UPI0036C173F8
MRPFLEILKFTAAYAAALIAVYITFYLLQHILPMDLNPPVQIDCPAEPPAPNPN